MDSEKIKEGVKLILEGIGEDVDREGLKDTPDRVARACGEIFGGMKLDPAEHYVKKFKANNNNMVIEHDIPFCSMCEHHLLPFYGKAHVAYIPDDQVAGLSKLARTVETFARRPQIQENMTAQIADAINDNLGTKGVMVLIEAEHMCMTMRGVNKPGAKTITTVTRGAFDKNYNLQQAFLQGIKGF
ncbi:MAG: GTP cyclohydrolase I FolE [Firmicutes bacterium]|nr:GTP cyclohydrolase I FolE [Bacillota bacterium]